MQEALLLGLSRTRGWGAAVHPMLSGPCFLLPGCRTLTSGHGLCVPAVSHSNKPGDCRYFSTGVGHLESSQVSRDGLARPVCTASPQCCQEDLDWPGVWVPPHSSPPLASGCLFWVVCWIFFMCLPRR